MCLLRLLVLLLSFVTIVLAEQLHEQLQFQDGDHPPGAAEHTSIEFSAANISKEAAVAEQNQIQFERTSLIRIDATTIQKLNDYSEPIVLGYYHSSDENHDKYLKLMQTAAHHFQSNVMVGVIDCTKSENIAFCAEQDLTVSPTTIVDIIDSPPLIIKGMRTVEELIHIVADYLYANTGISLRSPHAVLNQTGTSSSQLIDSDGRSTLEPHDASSDYNNTIDAVNISSSLSRNLINSSADIHDCINITNNISNSTKLFQMEFDAAAETHMPEVITVHPSSQSAGSNNWYMLDENNFDAAFVINRPVLIMYHASFDIKSRLFLPEFTSLAKKFAAPIVFAYVDCEKSSSLCSEQDVLVFPTIRFHESAFDYQLFTGHRNLTSLHMWLLQRISAFEQRIYGQNMTDHLSTDLSQSMQTISPHRTSALEQELADQQTPESSHQMQTELAFENSSQIADQGMKNLPILTQPDVLDIPSSTQTSHSSSNVLDGVTSVENDELLSVNNTLVEEPLNVSSFSTNVETKQKNVTIINDLLESSSSSVKAMQSSSGLSLSSESRSDIAASYSSIALPSKSIINLHEVGPNNYKDFIHTLKPIVWVFADRTNPDDNIQLLPVEHVAQHFGKDVNFLLLDDGKWSSHRKYFSLSTTAKPGIAIENRSTGAVLPFNGPVISSSSLTSFITAFLEINDSRPRLHDEL